MNKKRKIFFGILIFFILFASYATLTRNTLEKYTDDANDTNAEDEIEGEQDADAEEEKESNDVEKSLDAFLKHYKIFADPRWTPRRSQDGTRYEIYGYTLISCKMSRVSVIPYYIVKRKVEPLPPTRTRFTIPGYTLVFIGRDIPIGCDCNRDCPANNQPEFKLVDDWNTGYEIANTFSYKRIPCAQDGNSQQNMDQSSTNDLVLKLKDDQGYFICGKQQAPRLYSFSGQWNNLVQNFNGGELVIKIGQLENTVQIGGTGTSVIYRTTRLKSPKSYYPGTLFIVDVARIPNSMYTCSKLTLSDEFDLLSAIGGTRISSMVTASNADGTCQQTIGGSVKNCYTNPSECEYIFNGQTVEQFNRTGGGLICAFWDSQFTMKVWVISYRNSLYEQIKLGALEMNKWGEPYVIAKPCQNALRGQMQLTIQSEICNMPSQIPLGEEEMMKMWWQFRGLHIYEQIMK